MSDEPKKPAGSKGEYPSDIEGEGTRVRIKNFNRILTEAELSASVRYLVDSEGNKTAALVDIAVWEQLLTTLKRDQHIREYLLAQVRESGQIYEVGQASKALGELVSQFFEENIHGESRPILETMLLTESVLSRDWDTPEEDEAWASL